MNFEPTTDYKLVRQLLIDERCYRRMADDRAPAAADLAVGSHPGIEYILGLEAGNAIALFVLVNLAAGVEVHFCFSPASWGSTLQVAKAFLMWVWKYRPYDRLVGPVPDHNRLALRLAIAAGFRRFGTMKESVHKNRKVYDLNLLEITRPHDE